MDPIKIEATDRSPEVDFDFAADRYRISGESYPEDVTAFYGDLLGRLESHLAEKSSGSVQFDFELIYFNSSTAKVLMSLFETLDECAENGVKVLVTWAYEEDDDNMQELGEEFAEDLENAEFELKVIPIE